MENVDPGTVSPAGPNAAGHRLVGKTFQDWDFCSVGEHKMFPTSADSYTSLQFSLLKNRQKFTYRIF